MSQKLYVGNLSFRVEEQDLEQLFAQVGEIVSVRLVTDRDTGRSRGFAFVEMNDMDTAEKAIERLDGQDFEGRNLRVSIAQEKERDSRPQRRNTSARY